MEDALGSIRSVTDVNNNILESRFYSPFGELTQASGSPQTAFGFTGEQTDSNGLLYLRARYYNPTVAVFPNLDPLEGTPTSPQSLNRYSYVQGNPVNYRDPSGLAPFLAAVQYAPQGNPLALWQAVSSFNLQVGPTIPPGTVLYDFEDRPDNQGLV